MRVIPLQDSWARRQFVVCLKQDEQLSPTVKLPENCASPLR